MSADLEHELWREVARSLGSLNDQLVALAAILARHERAIAEIEAALMAKGVLTRDDLDAAISEDQADQLGKDLAERIEGLQAESAALRQRKVGSV